MMNQTETMTLIDRLPARETQARPARRSRTVWMPWIGGTRPNTTIEEAAFVMRLTDLADGRESSHNRSDITAVLNALRCGLLVDELLDRGPGLEVARLHAAYRAVDALRRESELAWYSIVSVPTVESLDAYGHEAAKLLPSLIGRLGVVADTAPKAIGPVVAQLASSVRITGSCVRSIEQALQEQSGQADQRADLRRLLYDPEGDGATSRQDHLARRLGTLVPARVAALLGEHVDVAETLSGKGLRT